MSFLAVGINSHKEYAMAQHKAELMIALYEIDHLHEPEL